MARKIQLVDKGNRQVRCRRCDEYQVLLPSNVKSNPRNKPNLYETELSKPLDLPGEWDVALINISYPHNWTNLDKSYPFFLLRRQFDTEDKPSHFVPDAEQTNYMM